VSATRLRDVALAVRAARLDLLSTGAYSLPDVVPLQLRLDPTWRMAAIHAPALRMWRRERRAARRRG
jgi:hypothetical protein